MLFRWAGGLLFCMLFASNCVCLVVVGGFITVRLWVSFASWGFAFDLVLTLRIGV